MIRICVCDYAERSMDEKCACDKNVNFASSFSFDDNPELTNDVTPKLIKYIMEKSWDHK